MPPVGRPRTTTYQGMRAPTGELGVPDLGLGGYGVVGNGGPLFGGSGPWRMFVDEWEYVPELRWPFNVRLYDQMRSDSQLAALLTAVMWGISQLRFVIDPNGAKRELVKEVSEDMNLPIMGEDDAPIGRLKHRFSHSRHVLNAMLAAVYGNMWFEQVGEIVNGKWRLRKLAPRMPHTIRNINVADDGGLVSLQQWAPAGWLEMAQANSQQFGPEIPVDRLVGYIFQQEGYNWAGRSMMRECYRDWLMKDRVSRIEVVNHERAGGVPYAVAPMGATVDEIQDLDGMMRQFRIGDTAGGALPYGAELKIAKGSGAEAGETIKRLDESMARRFLLMLFNLAQGGQNVGSYALSENFEDSFVMAQRHIAQWYCDTTTEHVIEDIVDWNYGEDEQYAPRITWERASEDALGIENIALLVQRGVITMDDTTENWFRYRYMMPKKTEPRPEISPGGPRQPTEQMSQKNEQQTGTEPGVEVAPVPTQAAGSGGQAPSRRGPAATLASLFKGRKPDVRASGVAVKTVANVELLHTGVEYQLGTGPKTFTFEDLRDLVQAANEDPAVPQPRLKIGHVDPRFDDDAVFDGTPAFGKATNLRLSENGTTVLADYQGVPAWLADILPYAYPSRSIEGYSDVTTQSGKQWRFVLSACSLLGVVWPGITVLEDLPQYYGTEVPEGVVIEEDILTAATAAKKSSQSGGGPMQTAASANLDVIRRAFYGIWASENPDNYMWWIQAVLTDPNQLVVEDDATGQLYLMSFKSNDKGEVSFGEPEPVRIDYVPDDVAVQKAAAKHVAAALASGRKVLASWSNRAESSPEDNTGGTMDPKAIRKLLSLPEDASDEQVKEAYAKLGTAAGIDLTVTAPEPPAAVAPATTEEVPAPAVTPPAPATAPAAASAAPQQLPPGMVMIDGQTLELLKTGASAGLELKQQTESDRRESLVSAALDDGRIAHAAKDRWITALETAAKVGDKSVEEALAALPKDLIPISMRGHGGGGDGSPETAAAQAQQVSDWSAELFPEVREMRVYDKARASGEPTNRSRVQRDAAYKR